MKSSTQHLLVRYFLVFALFVLNINKSTLQSKTELVLFCSHLFQRDRTRIPNPHELLRIFRFPTSEGREIARAAEKIEQTLNIVRTHIETGMVFNLTGKYLKASRWTIKSFDFFVFRFNVHSMILPFSAMISLCIKNYA